MAVKTNRTYVLLENYSIHHNTELKREEANPTKTHTKKNEGASRFSWRVTTSCLTHGNLSADFATNRVINRSVITTSRTYPWSFVKPLTFCNLYWLCSHNRREQNPAKKVKNKFLQWTNYLPFWYPICSHVHQWNISMFGFIKIRLLWYNIHHNSKDKNEWVLNRPYCTLSCISYKYYYKYTVKPAHAVASFKQWPVAKGILYCLVEHFIWIESLLKPNFFVPYDVCIVDICVTWISIT